MEDNIDVLTDKFVVYVELVHHCCFVTRESMHYTMLKKCDATGFRLPFNGSPSVKREEIGASSIHLVVVVVREGNTQELPINLDDDPVEGNP